MPALSSKAFQVHLFVLLDLETMGLNRCDVV